MEKYRILLLPGDGIGPEVITQAKSVLKVIEEYGKMGFELIERPCGYEYMAKTGMPWPKDTLEICKKTADAILLGAIGRANITESISIGDKTPGQIIVLGLRSELGLYANVRPVNLFQNVQHNISGTFKTIWNPENVNFVIIRENNEGFYYNRINKNNKFNISGKTHNEDHDLVPIEIPKSSEDINQITDERLITKTGTKQIVKFAFDVARNRNGAPLDGKKRITCVDKSNVLDGCRLFRNVFKEIAKDYPDIEPDYAYIDSFTLKILQKPEFFDVVVTSNLFGDIITDLAAMLQGGLGMAPSANLGLNHGMFEPIHGSAPDIAGKNIANPIGMILSTKMMLEWLGQRNDDNGLLRSADNIMTAIQKYLIEDKNLPHDIGGKANSFEVTQNIISNLKEFY